MDALLAVEQANREGYLEYRGQMALQARTQALGNLAMTGFQVGLSGAFEGLSLGGALVIRLVLFKKLVALV